MSKETVEDGMLLKEYRCLHATRVNCGKPSDRNVQNYKTQIQWIFSFLKLFKQKLNCQLFYFTSDKAKPSSKFATTLFFLAAKKKN